MSDAQRWQPDASLSMLQTRAALLHSVRDYFAAAGVLEVETPILSQAGNSDPALVNFSTTSAGQTLYLHSSPEYPMKRLLAAHGQSIYQICKVFRQDELGRYHNPEFTLLEWYRVGFDAEALMADIEAVTRLALPALSGASRLSYCELFRTHLQLDPLTVEQSLLREKAVALGVVVPLDADRDWLLQVLFDLVIGNWLKMQDAVFVYDYPASQAALARLHPDDARLAKRFELYVRGIELANGYEELTDSVEQAARFAQDHAKRRARGQHLPPVDQHLLAALQSGLPACAGVALGLDRLIMLATQSQHISEVLSFSINKA